MKHFITIVSIVVLFVTACSKEDDYPPSIPVIVLEQADAIYQTKVGRAVTISPTFQYADDATFAWTLNGDVIGGSDTLIFERSETGRYYIFLSVKNKRGVAEKELRIDVMQLDPPTIAFASMAEGTKVLQDSLLRLSPEVNTLLPTSYLWQIDGKDVSAEREFDFPTSTIGSYTVRFVATNDDGSDEMIFTVEVCSPDDMGFSWTFPQDVYNVSAGRSIDLTPLDIINAGDAVYTWSINGRQQKFGTTPDYIFTQSTQGVYNVTVEMKNKNITVSKTLIVNVCQVEGTFRRSVDAGCSPLWNKVYEFLPAPGQFVNENHVATTMQEACDYADERMKQEAYVSLGGFGGYIIVGFDHSIANDGGYNIAVTGNAFNGSSEPGIVWVMQDENGDGLPNDTWYELRGSEYGKEETWQNYAVTYFRPSSTGQSVEWKDNHAQAGTIDYLGAFHKQDYYYPLWVELENYTLRGTRLEARNYDKSGDGTYWVNDSYDWGYADNFSATDRLNDDENLSAAPSDNHFKISDAVRFDGQAANLAYADFVKIQVGINAKSGWLGEISTEVFSVKDYNLLK